MPLFIYLNNVEENIKRIKNYTKKEVMAVIKSDAYGIGAVKIIESLIKASINFFVFEKYQEYKKCKIYLKQNKVLIMESVSKSIIENETNNDVIFTINSYLDYLNIKDIEKKRKIHIRVDTGMNRFGIRNLQECKKIINGLKENENIIIDGIYTHFSSSLFESNYYEKQRRIFQEYTNLYNFPIIHANATKNLHKTIIGNFVRVGMAMYGYHQPFIRLKSTVSLIEKPVNIFNPKKLIKVGYTQISTKHVVGVIPLGYNEVDLTTVRYIVNNNQKYKLIGKSCMNHSHFIADDEINYLSWLSILPKNDIIVGSDDYIFPRQEDWYKILTSMKNIPKAYILRSKYDLPKVFKYRGEKSFRTRFRKRGNKIIDTRAI